MAIAPDIQQLLRTDGAAQVPAPCRCSWPAPCAPIRLATLDRLDPAAEREVLALAATCAGPDGVEPFGEVTRLALVHGGDAHAFAILARDIHDRLVGYAQLGCRRGTANADLAVAPAARGRGLGRRLLAALLPRARATGPGSLDLWARGDLLPARRLVRASGATPDRALLELERPLHDLPPAHLPAGVRLRPFRPGRDDAAWLALNNATFGWHPEQSGWTERELRIRLAEPWFRAEGFLLAEDADGLCGFAWTKLAAAPDGAMRGEIYVVGAAPRARGRGLGRALTLAGLHSMRHRGAAGCHLFVESDNAAARALYERLGFRLRALHVRYRVPLR